MSSEEPPKSEESPGAPQRNGPRFVVINDTQEKEDAFDLFENRHLERSTGLLGTIAYIVKGALGAGILGVHCGWAASGTIALPITIAMGIYMCFCLHLLVMTAQTIYKRTGVCSKMSYSDVGEAALAISESPKIRKLSKYFRFYIDFVICVNLFGGCCCNQLMVAGQIKQSVENMQETSSAALKPGYPNLKMYLLMLAVPLICICLIKHLDIIAKLSMVGNGLMLICIITSVYYSVKINPSMEGMTFFTTVKGVFILIGQTGFSMSCSGILPPIECNMKKPSQFPLALSISFVIITVGISIMGLFNYSAYGIASKTPVTVHFPLAVLPMILKLGVAFMLVISYALNFWIPFNLVFHYLKQLHIKRRRSKYEYLYRAIFSFACTVVAIVFPSVNKLMGFLGAFCLTNLAYIFPAVIWFSVHCRRPGLGPGKFRLILFIFILAIGLVLFCAGTYINSGELLSIFAVSDAKIDELDYPDTHEEDYHDYDI